MTFDHVAVPSNDIAASVDWYVKRLGAEVLYQDKSWAFMKVGHVKVALVSPQQHPPHVAVRIDEDALAEAAKQAGIPIDKHRDGTTGIYIHDPFGNAVELICYPPGETIYENAELGKGADEATARDQGADEATARDLRKAESKENKT